MDAVERRSAKNLLYICLASSGAWVITGSDVAPDSRGPPTLQEGNFIRSAIVVFYCLEAARRCRVWGFRPSAGVLWFP